MGKPRIIVCSKASATDMAPTMVRHANGKALLSEARELLTRFRK